ncbi:hypothetical protein ACSTIA_23415, partial [Vibrio parahaemolyticus]
AAPVRRAPAVRQAPVSAAPLPAPEPPMVEDAASGQAAPAADLPQPPIPPLPPLPSSFYAETQSGDPVQITATGKGARLPGGIEAETT